LLGTGPKLYYDFGFHPVRGEGVYLFDVDGRKYLDAYNNVPHVGHCHPRVVEAIARQAALLNTNTRYLFDQVLDYAERLVETAPRELDTVLFTCTGSEANDLAGRIARTVTGNHGILTTRKAYHGNTTFLDAIDGSSIREGRETVDWWATVSAPTDGSFEGEAFEAAARAYGSEMEAAIETLRERGYRPAAFFMDTYFCADGVYPTRRGFMQAAVNALRGAGGLVITDEVQPGLGRNGNYFWGFEQLGIVPDIVTSGKPLGNGHPVGMLLTRREIAEAFFAVDRYFNTFAGNPVSSVAGSAVLDVIRDENLQQNARDVGARLIAGLRKLGERHDIIYAVRGAGLLIGVELVLDRRTREPAGRETRHIINEMAKRGVLVGVTGPNRKARNVLKIRPPLVVTAEQADEVVTCLDDVLRAM
jgi:4-aminobutyrate aminotransferase-like enzyme